MIVTIYTAIGGVHAVIWNDVMQFCVRFGGLAAVVWIAARRCRADSRRSGGSARRLERRR